MKKIMMTVAMMITMVSSAYALDGSLSGEYKMFDHGYRPFEGILNLGQNVGPVRPFTEIKYNADNATVNGNMQHLFAEYKVGVGTTFLPNLALEAGVLFVQTLQKNTEDGRGAFVKATYSFDTSKKK